MARGTLLALAFTLALAACGGNGDQPAPDRQLPPGRTLRLAPHEIADMKAMGAQVTTRKQAEALARISGILESLSVREGDAVTSGQVIGRIVDSRIGYETAALGAQIAAAQAEAARANAELARVRFLHDKGVYATARLEQAQAAAHAADAQVAAATAQRRVSASLSGQGVVLAPASGRILHADIPAGSAVAPGMSIATVTAGPPVLRLELPESLAGRVRAGARVTVTEPDWPQGARQAVVSQVYPAVTGGRIRVDAALPGLPPATIGRRIAVSVEVGRRRALVVPRSFVATRFGIDQINVVTRDGQLSAVPVQTAATADPDSVEILSGAVAGDVLFAGTGT